MGSASREALARVRSELRAGIAPEAGSELLQAAGAIDESAALATSLGDASGEPNAKAVVVERLFAAFSADARNLLSAATRDRWSNVDEFVDGVEELGIRAEAVSEPKLADELLAVADLIDGNHELQLTLGSKLVASDGKVALVRRLLEGKVTASTIAVVAHLVASPRGRQLDGALRRAARTAADQQGNELATVTVATPLTADQQSRLAAHLERAAGRPVSITTVVDPELLGGVRIQIADDVIDGSVRARLDDLRQQLAA